MSVVVVANKREVILDATLSLLASRGFHGFSIRDVAKEAGVAIGTVYLYFQDREDLIKKLHGQIITQVVKEVFAPLDKDSPIYQQFRGICLRFWALFLAHPAMIVSKGQFDHLPLEVVRSGHLEAKEELAHLLAFWERGRTSGEIKNFPDEILFSLGFEPYFDMARKSLQGVTSVDQAMLERIIEATWDAIAVK